MVVSFLSGEFLEWIKTLSSETIEKNKLEVLSYHNLKYHKFFNLNGWTFENFKKFWAYVNRTEYYEDVKQGETVEKIPNVDNITKHRKKKQRR